MHSTSYPWEAPVRSSLAACVLILSPLVAVEQASLDQPVVERQDAVPPQALHPGDEIEIRVPGHEQLTAVVRIPVAGTKLIIPQLGSFDNPLGRTIDGLTKEVADRIHSQWVRDAVVDVVVTTYGPRHAYVLGGVRQPGVVDIDPYTQMTATKAVTVTGGFTDDANRASIHLVRSPLQNPENRHHSILRELDDPSAIGGDIQLQHGDMLVVDRLDHVYVMGQVNKPGTINLQPDGKLTLLKAISIVGGFDRFAKEDRVRLIRTGSPSRTVDLRGVLEGREGAIDPVLQPGDIIFVQGSDW